ncbi:hypothetical protein [Hutsoniella sourekii]|uniref:hypothetical protein n=1 Tax=Hutsoniella sourekii TaxID=87650 RepID=UPI000480FBC7|nr:hypothetical protein [Hutsoniella sourekii]
MTDKENFIRKFTDFLSSDKNKVLITGLDDKAKIVTTLEVLNTKYDRGLICCSELGEISKQINKSFERDILPQKISGQKEYKLGNMTVRFRKYFDSKGLLPIEENYDFKLYYPVQNVLKSNNKKYLNSLVRDINNTKSSKVIVITTNDLSINLSPLNDVMNQHIHYEISQDNPELLNTIISNIGDFEYPLL